MLTTAAGDKDPRTWRRSESIAVWIATFALFAAWSASPAPDVNEAHYLTKARQFWNPDWLPHDLFLSSPFVHWTFYATFGWPTLFGSLEQTAWLGRFIGWLALAFGWSRLGAALRLRPWATIVAALMFTAFTAHGNLSGEWVIGGIEAKVPSYAAVLLGLAFAIEGRWSAAWLALGVATAWHPLIGGWSLLVTVTLRLAQWKDAPSKSRERLWFLGSLAIGLGFGVVPAVLADSGSSSGIRSVAYSIYVRQRLSHHLWIWDFSVWNVVRFAMLVFLWGETAGWTNASGNAGWRVLHGFTRGSLLLVIVGIALSADVVPENWANSMLRYYLYRLADFAVPLAVALGVAQILSRTRRAGRISFALRDHDHSTSSLGFHSAGFATGIAVLLLSASLFAGRIYQHVVDPRSGAARQSLPQYADDWRRTIQTSVNWIRTCEWIRNNTPPDALFLTPRSQQTFKWLAQRAEYVNWKDIPQDSAGLMEWWLRMQIFAPDAAVEYYANLVRNPEQLLALGIDYLVVEQSIYEQSLPPQFLPEIPAHWSLVYPSESGLRTTYVVIDLRK